MYMARPTADTEQITFRLPSKWLKEADRVAKLLAQDGRAAGRTDGVRALIAAGLFVHDPEIAALADLLAATLSLKTSRPVSREDAIRVALLEETSDGLQARRKLTTKLAVKKTVKKTRRGK